MNILQLEMDLELRSVLHLLHNFVEQSDKPEALEYFTSIFGEALKVRAMVCLHSENKKTIDNQWFFCKLVELGGIEPPTPCMPCRCSPS